MPDEFATLCAELTLAALVAKPNPVSGSDWYRGPVVAIGTHAPSGPIGQCFAAVFFDKNADRQQLEAGIIGSLIRQFRDRWWSVRNDAFIDVAWEDRPVPAKSGVAHGHGMSVRAVVQTMPTYLADNRIPDAWQSVDDNYYLVGSDTTQRLFVCPVLRIDVATQEYNGPHARQLTVA